MSETLNKRHLKLSSIFVHRVCYDSCVGCGLEKIQYHRDMCKGQVIIVWLSKCFHIVTRVQNIRRMNSRPSYKYIDRIVSEA